MCGSIMSKGTNWMQVRCELGVSVQNVSTADVCMGFHWLGIVQGSASDSVATG
jgi:hypothetical protein